MCRLRGGSARLWAEGPVLAPAIALGEVATTLMLESRKETVIAIQGVCFDLYSTLVHEKQENPFYRDVAAELNLNLNRWMPAYRECHREAMLGRISGMFERVRRSVEGVGYQRPPEQVAAAVHQSWPKFLASIDVDPQTEALLDRLRGRGLPLALVSNASDHSEEIFQRLGLPKYFDVTVFSFRVQCLKPNPEIYQIALDGLALAPGQCAFVGDGGDRELFGARRIGLTTILVDRQLKHTDSARADADIVANDLVEVGAAIEERSAQA